MFSPPLVDPPSSNILGQNGVDRNLLKGAAGSGVINSGLLKQKCISCEDQRRYTFIAASPPLRRQTDGPRKKLIYSNSIGVRLARPVAQFSPQIFQGEPFPQCLCWCKRHCCFPAPGSPSWRTTPGNICFKGIQLLVP